MSLRKVTLLREIDRSRLSDIYGPEEEASVSVLGTLMKSCLSETFYWRFSNIFSADNNGIECAPDSCRSPSFLFVDASWYLNVSLETVDTVECMILRLARKDAGSPKHICFSLSIKEASQSKTQYFEKTFTLQDNSGTKFLKCERLRDALLTVRCKMMSLDDFRIQPESSNLEELDTLSADFKNLLESKETCDIILQLDDRKIMAHKAVLIARSSVFATMLKHNTLDKQTNEISIPDCDAETFQMFIEYLYTGRLENIHYSKCFDLYYMSNKYDVQKLKPFCLQCMEKNLTVANVCEIAAFADRHDEHKLIDTVQDYFNQNMASIFKTDNWKSLMRNYDDVAQQLLKKMADIAATFARCAEAGHGEVGQ